MLDGVKFFFLLSTFRLQVFTVLIKYLIAVCLCSGGWQESFAIMMSVVVGFGKILNDRLFPLSEL